MANQEHIGILKNGVEAWNRWRDDNPDIEPDLSEIVLNEILPKKEYSIWFGEKQKGVILKNINFSKTNLSWANLERANLSGANLERANLDLANLSGANLERANLYDAKLSEAKLQKTNLFWAKLEGAKLIGANLVKANLSRANLQGANLYKANLYKANLKEANLEKAKLQGAKLVLASLKNTKFSSKKQLNYLKNPLSEKHLIEAIFLDEQEKERIEIDEKKLPFIQIKFQKERWRLDNLGMLFLFLNRMYMNLYDLYTHNEENYEKILSRLDNIYHDDKEIIKIKSIEKGSFKLLLFFLLPPEISKPILEISFSLLKDGIAFFKAINAKEKENAEINKMNAETEKIKAETRKIDAETEGTKIENKKNELMLLNQGMKEVYENFKPIPENEKKLEKHYQDTIPDDRLPNNKTIRKNKGKIFTIVTSTILTSLGNIEDYKTEINFYENEKDN